MADPPFRDDIEIEIISHPLLGRIVTTRPARAHPGTTPLPENERIIDAPFREATAPPHHPLSEGSPPVGATEERTDTAPVPLGDRLRRLLPGPRPRRSPQERADFHAQLDDLRAAFDTELARTLDAMPHRTVAPVTPVAGQASVLPSSPAVDVVNADPGKEPTPDGHEPHHEL